MNRLKRFASTIYVLLAGCQWGCMGLLVRPLNKLGLQSMDIVAIRGFVTVILTFLTFPLLCKLTGAKCAESNGSKSSSSEANSTKINSMKTSSSEANSIFRLAKDNIIINPKDIWVFVGTGIVSVVFFNFCYFNTIIYTSLSVAAIMLYTAPIFVMLISAVVFKDRITKVKLVALILAFAGCGVVTGAFTGQMVLDLRGILFGLGAGIGYALYSIFGKLAAQKNYSSATITLYTFLFASIGVLPFIRLQHIIEVFSQNGGVIYTIVLIVITTFLPYIFYTLGLSQMEPGKAAIIACIEPVMATLVGLVAFDEIPTVVTLLGVALVIGAIVLINMQKSNNN